MNTKSHYETIHINQLNDLKEKKNHQLVSRYFLVETITLMGQGCWGSIIAKKLGRLTSKVLSSPDIYYVHTTFILF